MGGELVVPLTGKESMGKGRLGREVEVKSWSSTRQAL